MKRALVILSLLLSLQACDRPSNPYQHVIVTQEPARPPIQMNIPPPPVQPSQVSIGDYDTDITIQAPPPPPPPVQRVIFCSTGQTIPGQYIWTGGSYRWVDPYCDTYHPLDVHFHPAIYIGGVYHQPWWEKPNKTVINNYNITTNPRREASPPRTIQREIPKEGPKGDFPRQPPEAPKMVMKSISTTGTTTPLTIGATQSAKPAAPKVSVPQPSTPPPTIRMTTVSRPQPTPVSRPSTTTSAPIIRMTSVPSGGRKK